jgi:hypothetical protein
MHRIGRREPPFILSILSIPVKYRNAGTPFALRIPIAGGRQTPAGRFVAAVNFV